MANYNELCWATGYEVVGDDEDLHVIENLDPKEEVVVEKKVEDGVKIEKDNLDDVIIDLWTD